jgi:hypothetical protein
VVLPFSPFEAFENSDVLFLTASDMLFSIMTANAIWMAAACLLHGEQVPALGDSPQEITMAVFAFTFLIRPLEFADTVIGFFGALGPRSW